ncbi:MAG: hypothetical protein AAGK14_09905 [Verrucomicrobiota bacterium]
MRSALAGLLAVVIAAGGGAAFPSEKAGARLGPRLQFPGFSLQVPEGFRGPGIKRQRPATYLTWVGPKRVDSSHPLYLVTVTDINAAPEWTGYAGMTIGELTDHFVREIARNSVGFKAGDMEEVEINGIAFRRVPYSCEIKNNAMELVPMRGWVMAARGEGFLYTLNASDKASEAGPTLGALAEAAATFRWEEERMQEAAPVPSVLDANPDALPPSMILPPFQPAKLPPVDQP